MTTITTPVEQQEAPQAVLLPPKSRTLLRLEKSPDTICARCPNAVWHTVKKANRPVARVFCTLMHALMDQELQDCDGLPDEVPEVPAQVQQAAEIRDYGLPMASEEASINNSGFLNL